MLRENLERSMEEGSRSGDAERWSGSSVSQPREHRWGHYVDILGWILGMKQRLVLVSLYIFPQVMPTLDSFS